MEEIRKHLRELTDDFVDKLVNITIKEGNRMTVVRLREARARARTSKGRAPYGSYPHEKDGLDLMLRMRNDGCSYRVIAEAMERHGFATRAGVYWNPGTITRILKKHGVA